MTDQEMKSNLDEIKTLVEGHRAELKKGKDADATVLANYEKKLGDLDAKHNAHVAAKDAEAKALKAQLDDLEAKFNRMKLGTGGAAEVPAETKAAAEAWNAYLRFGNPATTPMAGEKWEAESKRRGIKLEQKALTIGDDTTGGYLSGPADYVKEIIKAIVLISPMRQVVNVRTTSMRNVQLPKRTGTAAAVWVAESATRAETQNPSYGLVDCPVHELTAEIYVSFQDLEDSAFNLEEELNKEFAEQFAVSEGLAVVSGDSKGKPWGFTDAGQGVANTPSGTAATIADVNGQANGLITMVHAVKSGYAANGKMLLNRQTLGSVRKLQDAQKRYLWQPAISLDMPSTIAGFAYMETPDMPNEGANTFPIAFGDFKRAYTLVDRLAISVMRDPFSKASAGQVKFLARRRVGGQVVLAEAIRLLQCHT